MLLPADMKRSIYDEKGYLPLLVITIPVKCDRNLTGKRKVCEDFMEGR